MSVDTFAKWELKARLALDHHGISHHAADLLIEAVKDECFATARDPWDVGGPPEEFAAAAAAAAAGPVPESRWSRMVLTIRRVWSRPRRGTR